MRAPSTRKEVAAYLRGDKDRRREVHSVGTEAGMRGRRDRIMVAGARNWTAVLADLGCNEQMTWWDGRHLADPTVRNPYRTEPAVISRTYTCTSGLPEGTCSCYACHGG